MYTYVHPFIAKIHWYETTQSHRLVQNFGSPIFQQWLCLNMGLVHSYLVGGIPTPLKNDGVRQSGWWNSQYMESHKIHVPNHHPSLATFETTNQLWITGDILKNGNIQLCPTRVWQNSDGIWKPQLVMLMSGTWSSTNRLKISTKIQGCHMFETRNIHRWKQKWGFCRCILSSDLVETTKIKCGILGYQHFKQTRAGFKTVCDSGFPVHGWYNVNPGWIIHGLWNFVPQ